VIPAPPSADLLDTPMALPSDILELTEEPSVDPPVVLQPSEDIDAPPVELLAAPGAYQPSEESKPGTPRLSDAPPTALIIIIILAAVLLIVLALWQPWRRHYIPGRSSTYQPIPLENP